MTATVENSYNANGATDLLPMLRALKHKDKLFLIQFLANELTLEEQIFPMSTSETYYVWSPYDSTDAAQVLLQFIENNTQP